MWPAAAGIALMSFTESIAAGARVREARRAASRSRTGSCSRSALANVAGGLLGAMPAGGGTSQTAVNRLRGRAHAGRRDRHGGGGAGDAAAARAAHLALMPQAALAAVVVVYSLGLIQPAEFREIRRVRRTEFCWALIALRRRRAARHAAGHPGRGDRLAACRSPTRPTIRRSTSLGRKRGTDVFRRRPTEHPDDETWPGLLILRTEGRLFFANAQRVGDKMWPLVEQAKPPVVVLDCSAVFDIEYTALKMLDRGRGEAARATASPCGSPALNPQVLDVVRAHAARRALGRERMFFNLDAAVERVRASCTSHDRHRPLFTRGRTMKT